MLKMEIYQINNYHFPFSNCKDCNLYMFCVSPRLLSGTSNGHGGCSSSPFQPSTSTTMCPSGRGQRCFSIMVWSQPSTSSFALLMHLLVTMAHCGIGNKPSENATVWPGSYQPTCLYTHLILILLLVILQPTLLAFVVNIEHLSSENNHLGRSIHLFS